MERSSHRAAFLHFFTPGRCLSPHLHLIFFEILHSNVLCFANNSFIYSVLRSRVCVYWLPVSLKILPDSGTVLYHHLLQKLQTMEDNSVHLRTLFAWVTVSRHIRSLKEMNLELLVCQFCSVNSMHAREFLSTAFCRSYHLAFRFPCFVKVVLLSKKNGVFFQRCMYTPCQVTINAIMLAQNKITYYYLCLFSKPDNLLTEALFSSNEDISSEAIALLCTTQKKAGKFSFILFLSFFVYHFHYVSCLYFF